MARNDPRVNVFGSSLSLEKLPPTLLLTAGKDVLLPENMKFASRMKSSDTQFQHIHYPEYEHGWVSFAGCEKQELFDEMKKLIH